MVNDRVLALDAAAYQHMNITFSAQTSARITQELIDSKLDKRRKVRLRVTRSLPLPLNPTPYPYPYPYPYP